jgi:hypothetical protein
MQELFNNQLVHPVNPWNVLHNPTRTFNIFIDYLANPAFDAHERVSALSRNYSSQIKAGNFRARFTRIHEDKFDYEVFKKLIEMHLAVKDKEGWYLVERATANDLMTFLASVLGQTLQYQPATDQHPGRYIFQGDQNDLVAYETADGKRQHILNKLIPFPEEIDLTKFRQFKDKHYDLLKAFKNRVELIALDPTLKIHTPFYKEKVEELQRLKDEISAKMNERKLGKIIFGAVCGIVAGVGGIATASSAAGVAFAVPALAGAIYTAAKIERPEDVRDQSGLKYLALVDKRIRKINRWN